MSGGIIPVALELQIAFQSGEPATMYQSFTPDADGHELVPNHRDAPGTGPVRTSVPGGGVPAMDGGSKVPSGHGRSGQMGV